MSKIDKEQEKLEQTLLDQLSEDRTLVKDMYEKLSHITNTQQDFALNGLNMVKLLELAQKQTAQIAEILKNQKKKQDKDDEPLNDGDTENIWTDLEKK